ncbi:MAG: hypothetical protein AVDCRST_MAG30-981, partial [uncultured Solirubrobacteraceae bacterium]
APPSRDPALHRAPPRPHGPRRPGPVGQRERLRRGVVGRDERQGRDERRVHPDRVLPPVHPDDEHPPAPPGQAQGSPQGGREGPQGAGRPARRLV